MLSGIADAVSGGVQGAAWVGPVALKFKATWSQVHSPSLRAAVEMLQAQAKVLSTQADEQDQASQAGGSPQGSPSDSRDIVATAVEDGFLLLRMALSSIGLIGPLVDASTMADDRLDPDELTQGTIGDCWVLAPLLSLMDSDAGDQFLRNNVSWDPVKNGYWVTLYPPPDATPTKVFVGSVFRNGVTTMVGPDDSKYGCAAIYEAAISKQVGYDHLDGGGWPDESIQLITGRSCDKYDPGNVTAEAINQAVGNHYPVVAGTSRSFEGDGASVVDMWHKDGTTMSPYVCGDLAANHAYEVVGVDPSGMIGLRNPHGEPGEDGGGVFYISRADFDSHFAQGVWVAH